MPRRPKRPEATLGKDGLWHCFPTVGTKPNGRPDQRHVKRKTKGEAEERADELLQQAREGAAVRPGRPQTLQQWLEVYLDTVAPRRCDPTTVKGYASKMRLYVYPVIGRVRLDRLQPHHLDEVYVRMSRDGRADSTVLQTHRILSRALEVALRRKMVPRNVAKLIDAPTARRPEMAPPTEREAQRVLDAAAGRRNAARWQVGLALGLRQGEALGLRWPFVDLESDEPHLRIFWQLHRRGYEHGCAEGAPTCGRRFGGDCPQRRLPLRSGEIQLSGGKILKPPKGKSKRVVPLPPELVAALRAHREVQALEAMMDPAYAGHDLVFAQPDGAPIDHRADWDEWQELERAAGVEGRFRVHDGRHFAATFLLALGVDIRVVQEILGHSSIKVTEGYSHVASKMAMDAMRAAGSKLFGRTES